MSKNANNGYNIYLKSEHRWLPVSKQQFDDYYRDISAQRIRMQAHGRCICPASKRYLCDMDCLACEYRKAGDVLSLDNTVTDDEGNEISWLETMEDDTPSVQSILEDAELLQALNEKLKSLDPEGQLICECIMNGLSEREAAKVNGLSRNTYAYRRDKLLKSLAIALKDYI